MSFSAMVRGLAKWRESTTTSPSGKHLGIYKALVTDHLHVQQQQQKQKQAQPKPTSISHIALQIQHLIINLAIKHTHTLSRWKTVHNFFIEKIPGQPLLDKLRVIHIYEADWNLILKYFLASQLTRTACHEKTVTVEQAGGRLGRCSSDMATKTILTHEICRLQKLQGAVIYNDAKACFDRIIENMSNLACMREGLSPQIAALHAQTLQHIKYYIKTQHGCGEAYNGHMLPDAFLGSGQGAGDSMARWGFVSDVLIRAYNKSAKSNPLIAPISHLSFLEHIQAFVDDSHGLIVHNIQDTTSLNSKIQH
jgi:hypothetical protein